MYLWLLLSTAITFGSGHPVHYFEAEQRQAEAGEAITLHWSAAADECRAASPLTDWSGDVPPSGSRTIRAERAGRYYLELLCVADDQEWSAAATLAWADDALPKADTSYQLGSRRIPTTSGVNPDGGGTQVDGITGTISGLTVREFDTVFGIGLAERPNGRRQEIWLAPGATLAIRINNPSLADAGAAEFVVHTADRPPWTTQTRRLALAHAPGLIGPGALVTAPSTSPTGSVRWTNTQHSPGAWVYAGHPGEALYVNLRNDSNELIQTYLSVGSHR